MTDARRHRTRWPDTSRVSEDRDQTRHAQDGLTCGTTANRDGRSFSHLHKKNGPDLSLAPLLVIDGFLSGICVKLSDAVIGLSPPFCESFATTNHSIRISTRFSALREILRQT
ncbi:hypothetical protein D4Q71_04685 [Rhodopseudomonas palustris]|uniref:Uncharacterized protein n=1 Tax=Rhodopseudomonas palustris (strain ATCC BAA-98 / CGA009) TaxID=258594 RepID=Q6N0S1_RHOPA|nr:hypothetical protein B1S06_05195 [Rhodopseudomonas palustris]PPQ41019.1 hypothetical protein CKO39_24160 [Rhodopseudomonas palustris]RJF67371.1 hypothetical protein D4Q71_04685 [Rhodopseudomonas palustris]CAE30130.1 hypothetical protein RPA4690 [Rhodopseudomonas palustris CGA009]